MATLIDLTCQGQCIEFSGTSEENIGYAKTFWQSLQLQPPMESQLVSSDIRQRLKVAPIGAQTVNMAHVKTSVSENYCPAMQSFHQRSQVLGHLDEMRHVSRVMLARAEDLDRLQTSRNSRIVKESVSHRKRMSDSLARHDHDRGEYRPSSTELHNDIESVHNLDLIQTERNSTSSSSSSSDDFCI